jgi:microcystin-dependent protein
MTTATRFTGEQASIERLAVIQDRISAIERMIGTGLSGAIVPIGGVVPFYGTTAPITWLLCYGQLVAKTDYPVLWNTIGHAGNAGVDPGGGQFKIPDLRGKTLVGLDNIGGSDAGILSMANTLGLTGGAETVTLITANLPSHTHAIDHDHASVTSAAGSSHTHSGSGSTGSGSSHSHSGSGSTSATSHSHTASGSSSATSHSHTGSTASTSHSHTGSTAAVAHGHPGSEIGNVTYMLTQQAHDHSSGSGGYVSEASDPNDGVGTPVPLNIATESTHTHGVTVNSESSHTHGVTVNSESSHTHAVSVTVNSESSHTHAVSVSVGSEASHTHSVTVSVGSEATHTHSVDIAAFTGASGSAGSGTAVSLLQPYSLCNWIIRAE